MKGSTLEAFNLEDDSNPLHSNAKVAEESLTGLLHTVNMNTAFGARKLKEQDALIPATWQNSASAAR